MTAAEEYLAQAIRLACQNVRRGGRPFGAVIVRDGTVIAEGINQTADTGDPTAHAELVAIRAAAQALGTPDLSGCTIYASGHPCPMCLGAMYMSGIAGAFYAYSNDDGAPTGFTTAGIYDEFAQPESARSVRMTYLPVRPAGEPDPYALWQATAGG